MPTTFISYRRADSRAYAGRIFDRFVQAFGRASIFKDVDSIAPGVDFRHVLANAVGDCDVLLAVIGPQWLSIADENGKRRLDNPADFVRIEIESALERNNCRVIPVLVDNAQMPAADELPVSLQLLAYKNAVAVRDDPDFHNDISRLIRHLEQQYPAAPSAPSQPVAAFDVYAAINAFGTAFEAGDWEQARTLLAQIRASGKAPRFFDVDAQEKKLHAIREEMERARAYDVVRLIARQNDAAMLQSALAAFWEQYPGYDPDRLGVKVAPPSTTPVAAVVAPPAAQLEAAEQAASYTLRLVDAGSKKINVIKVVRQITSWGLKEAKDAVEQAPSTILESVDRGTATAAQQALEAEGARVEIVGTPISDQVDIPVQLSPETHYDLFLLSFDINRKIATIKAVRDITTWGLRETKDAVESAPVLLLTDMESAAAQRALEILEELGATVGTISRNSDQYSRKTADLILMGFGNNRADVTQVLLANTNLRKSDIDSFTNSESRVVAKDLYLLQVRQIMRELIEHGAIAVARLRTDS